MLNDEQKSFFMDLENTFNSPGWARLTQGWKQEAAALPEAGFYNAKSMQDLDSIKVRLGLLNELVQLPETIERMKDEILEQAQSE